MLTKNPKKSPKNLFIKIVTIVRHIKKIIKVLLTG